MTGIEVGTDGFTVDADLVAERFGIGTDRLRDLMRAGTITTVCETGEGADTGRSRLNFIYGNRVLQLVVDGAGNQVEAPRIEYLRSQPRADAR